MATKNVPARREGAPQITAGSTAITRPLLRLLPPPPYVDSATVEALEDLLERAKDGRVIGIAFTATMPGRQYLVDVAGAAFANDPTYARGAVAALDDWLRVLVDEQAG